MDVNPGGTGVSGVFSVADAHAICRPPLPGLRMMLGATYRSR